MDCRQNKNTLIMTLIIFFSMIIAVYSPAQRLEAKYQFRETINLINFVKQAAEQVAKHGKLAFLDFNKQGSKWYKGQKYIFVYDLNGFCVFHPIEKDFIGKNMLYLRDMNNKPIIKHIVDIASISENAEGWVHYLWANMGEFFPEWKNAFVMRVRGPDGKDYAIGSGTYDIRTEKEFMTTVVDSAYFLIKREGDAAFAKLMDKSTIYHFEDIYVFVISMEGKAIVDPVFPGIAGRNLAGFRDKVGNYVVVDIIEKLEFNDKALVLYAWPRPGLSNPSKKVAYVRKVKVNGEYVIVGSSMYIEEPIWKNF